MSTIEYVMMYIESAMYTASDKGKLRGAHTGNSWLLIGLFLLCTGSTIFDGETPAAKRQKLTSVPENANG